MSVGRDPTLSITTRRPKKSRANSANLYGTTLCRLARGAPYREPSHIIPDLQAQGHAVNDLYLSSWPNIGLHRQDPSRHRVSSGEGSTGPVTSQPPGFASRKHQMRISRMSCLRAAPDVARFHKQLSQMNRGITAKAGSRLGSYSRPGRIPVSSMILSRGASQYP